MILRAGQSHVVEIPYSANPQPKVTWTFNGGKFTDARRIKDETIITMTSLTMAKVQRGDSGKYKVEMQNEFGKGSFTVKVIVLGELLKWTLPFFCREYKCIVCIIYMVITLLNV